MPDDKFLSAPIDAAGYIDLGKGDILERARRALAGVTEGPWRWEVNPTARGVQLCGGRPKFDHIVMDFVRWGMTGATPRFLARHEHAGLLLHKAEQFLAVVPGREHHANWFQTIDQPDARFIAAAPTLVRDLMAEVELRGQCLDGMRAEIETLRAEVERLRAATPYRMVHKGASQPMPYPESE